MLTKDDRVLFIPDDIAYFFPNAKNYDYDQPFEKEGWRDLESCPKCGSLNLFPPSYDQEKMTEVGCVNISSKDLGETDGIWALTEACRIKLNSEQ